MATTFRNRLTDSKSPYLLQHASNPVDWFPWGEEAFQEARNRDKLIFLSVGYSTCHWCHVMERESFESQEVADIMNENFVNVKVDREERPDVDKVYMTFVQATLGGGGWPMSVFLTPKLQPIFGGTYFPPEDDPRTGRPGFKSLLTAISSQWEADKENMIESGEKIAEGLSKAVKASLSGGVGGREQAADAEETAKKCFSQLLRSYDPEFGGFSRAPKFPQPCNFNFLFALYAQDRDSDRGKQALKMCLKTLEMMSLGGINDHVSKGFARYSTDGKWHVPHFEKMLYDQGQLAVAYANAYKATKEAKFAETLRDILEYVERDLWHPEGGFFSAEDADSKPASDDGDKKKEGAFCVWTKDELESLLQQEGKSLENHLVTPPKGDEHEKEEEGEHLNGGKSLSDLFCRVYNVRQGGNVDPAGDPHGELKGQNVLTRIPNANDDLRTEFGLESDEKLEILLEKCRLVLFEARRKRPRPHLDDKIVTAWNGLMISGFSAAAAALQEPKYAAIAEKAVDFVRKHLYDEKRKVLLRSAYSGETEVTQFEEPIDGFVDDYSYFIRGLLDLYSVNFDSKLIDWAVELQEKQDSLFWDETSYGYFTASGRDPNIILRLKEDQDGAEPAANSVAAQNLLRLSSMLDRPSYKDRAVEVFSAFGERLKQIPLALPEMSSALLFSVQPAQVIITKSPASSEANLLKVLQTELLPSHVLLMADDVKEESILCKSNKIFAQIQIPGGDDKEAGKEKAFVCRNYSCSLPVKTEEELKNLLGL